jgi:hypothetical protein
MNNLHEGEVLEYVTLPIRGIKMPSMARVVVPGGWLYSTFDYSEGADGGVNIFKAMSFVPFQPEGENVEHERFAAYLRYHAKFQAHLPLENRGASERDIQRALNALADAVEDGHLLRWKTTP